MDLNKENIRKIKELIVFTALILIGLWKYTLVLDILKFISGNFDAVSDRRCDRICAECPDEFSGTAYFWQ